MLVIKSVGRFFCDFLALHRFQPHYDVLSLDEEHRDSYSRQRFTVAVSTPPSASGCKDEHCEAFNSLRPSPRLISPLLPAMTSVMTP